MGFRNYRWIKAIVTGNTTANFTEIDGSALHGGSVAGIVVGMVVDFIAGGATAADIAVKDGTVTAYSVISKTGLSADTSYGATDLDGKPITGTPTATGANVSAGTTIVHVYLCVAQG